MVAPVQQHLLTYCTVLSSLLHPTLSVLRGISFDRIGVVLLQHAVLCLFGDDCAIKSSLDPVCLR